jgi:hypothetical protein
VFSLMPTILFPPSGIGSISMINEYVNFEREALNTSTNDPILVRFSCNLEGKTQNPGVNYTKRINFHLESI